MMLLLILDTPKLIDLLALLGIAMKKAFDSSSQLLTSELVKPAANFLCVDLSLSYVNTVCEFKPFELQCNNSNTKQIGEELSHFQHSVTIRRIQLLRRRIVQQHTRDSISVIFSVRRSKPRISKIDFFGLLIDH